jgi:hypothetical protein
MCPCKRHYLKSARCTCACDIHKRFRKVAPDATEPEDKADLYVEPEPLKEDQNVLVWARVVDAKPDSDGEVEVSLRRADGYDTSYATTYTLPDAIVRPDAGQVPPWVKPVEEPMGLGAVVEADAPAVLATAFVRTGLDESHPWCMGTTRAYYSWDELKNPRVLSEGITESGAS